MDIKELLQGGLATAVDSQSSHSQEDDTRPNNDLRQQTAPSGNNFADKGVEPIAAYPARVTVPGENPPWHIATGRQTSQPPRQNLLIRPRLSPNMRFGTGTYMRAQQKAESDARALQQQMATDSPEKTPLKTILPKDDDLLVYDETEEDSNMPLFPQQRQQQPLPTVYRQQSVIFQEASQFEETSFESMETRRRPNSSAYSISTPLDSTIGFWPTPQRPVATTFAQGRNYMGTRPYSSSMNFPNQSTSSPTTVEGLPPPPYYVGPQFPTQMGSSDGVQQQTLPRFALQQQSQQQQQQQQQQHKSYHSPAVESIHETSTYQPTEIDNLTDDPFFGVNLEKPVEQTITTWNRNLSLDQTIKLGLDPQSNIDDAFKPIGAFSPSPTTNNGIDHVEGSESSFPLSSSC